MKVIELAPGQEVEGCLVEAICGCLTMRTYAMKLITYHTSAEIPVLFAKKEGHYVVIQLNASGTELELVHDYGKCTL